MAKGKRRTRGLNIHVGNINVYHGRTCNRCIHWEECRALKGEEIGPSDYCHRRNKSFELRKDEEAKV